MPCHDYLLSMLDVYSTLTAALCAPYAGPLHIPELTLVLTHGGLREVKIAFCYCIDKETHYEYTHRGDKNLCNFLEHFYFPSFCFSK